jgi:hypothetical protein
MKILRKLGVGWSKILINRQEKYLGEQLIHFGVHILFL